MHVYTFQIKTQSSHSPPSLSSLQPLPSLPSNSLHIPPVLKLIASFSLLMSYTCACMCMHKHKICSLLRLGLLFVCIRFRGWPLCIGQPRRGIILPQQPLVACGSSSGGGVLWDAPSALVCLSIQPLFCPCLVSHSRRDCFAVDILVFWLLQPSCLLFLNGIDVSHQGWIPHDLQISALCPAVISVTVSIYCKEKASLIRGGGYTYPEKVACDQASHMHFVVKLDCCVRHSAPCTSVIISLLHDVPHNALLFGSAFSWLHRNISTP